MNFRGDSLQGANYDNIDFHGRGDAYDTLPGFLKPSEDNGGWPKAVDNYLRLNFSGVRIHQVPATPYMLDVADERGLMLQDEPAIRGSNNRENFTTGRDNMVKHLADLVKRDRNHASVLRWSQSNEPMVAFFVNPGAGPEFDEALYQTVMGLDSTRPISTDAAVDPTTSDLPHDNYTVFCHYDGFSFGRYSESICSGPAGKPRGQGEFVWFNDHTPQGARWFATASLRMREQGASDIRPYTLLDVWSSVIPGVERTQMHIESGYPDSGHPLLGEDNLPNPWQDSRIQLIQNAFNPVAAIDTDFWNANKLSNEAGEWPTTPATVAPGEVTRTLEPVQRHPRRRAPDRHLAAALRVADGPGPGPGRLRHPDRARRPPNGAHHLRRTRQRRRPVPRPAGLQAGRGDALPGRQHRVPRPALELIRRRIGKYAGPGCRTNPVRRTRPQHQQTCVEMCA